MGARECPHTSQQMIDKFRITDNVSKLIYFTDKFDKTILSEVKSSLDALNIKYICGLKPEVNPTRRPCYIRWQYSIIVRQDDEALLAELFTLSAPQKTYDISQHAGKTRAKFNVKQ